MKVDIRGWLACATIGILVLSSALGAQEEKKQDGIRVGYSAVCVDVQNLEPLGVDTTFSASVGSLYCFTRIEGATDTTNITHVWYHGEKKMAEVILPVKSVRWRTYSSKKILPNWSGKWNVVVLSEAGDPLAQISFFIRASRPE